MFFRLHTDATRQEVDVVNHFAGPMRSTCWIICGGPSLNRLPLDLIRDSPSPKFCVNLAGVGLLRPDFWTSYDPTSRFLRTTYLDPSIMKFVHRCRASDLIPETTYKVCEAPNALFFDRDRQRGFADFPSSSPGSGIVDWQDSFIQAIDIAYRLGFRRLLLAGCEMFIKPSATQQRVALECGVEYIPREPLRDFFRRCQHAGLKLERMAALDPPTQYHFEEHKPLPAAIQTDEHYFRIVQYLRLSRRALALAGLELVSVTPVSRLNDHFPCQLVEQVSQSILDDVGDPSRELTRGRYTSQDSRLPAGLAPMRDFRPHFWKPDSRAEPVTRQKPPVSTAVHRTGKQRLRNALDEAAEIEIPIQEIG